jgi:hypothetical protein
VSKIDRSIEAALEASTVIPHDTIAQWCRDADELGTLALLYRLTAEGHERIEPPLAVGEACTLMRRYFLECIRLDPQDGLAITRHEAAWTLEAWLDHLTTMPGTSDVVREAVEAVTQLYLAGSPEVQNAIETGFLEHVLEQTRLRPLFEHWRDDPRLRGSWDAALAWGDAHPDLTKRLRERGLAGA